MYGAQKRDVTTPVALVEMQLLAITTRVDSAGLAVLLSHRGFADSKGARLKT
jgi:ABC-type transporter Mla MlaB component